MTIIDIKDGTIKATGHSGYGTNGNDIVCAAISTLIESTYYYLKCTDNDVKKDDGDGLFNITYKKMNDSGIKIIYCFFELIKDLEKQYPKYIKVRGDL